MVPDKLKHNSLKSLKTTLYHLSQLDAQQQYQATVPIVHVPNELACQWEAHSRLLHSQEWFKSLFSSPELEALIHFDTAVREFLNNRSPCLDELDDLVNDPDWQGIAARADTLLALLNGDTSGDY